MHVLQRLLAPALVGIALCAPAAAQAAADAAARRAAPSGSFAVRCGTLLTGDGETVLRDCWLVVKDGKVASVGRESPPEDLPVVDARDRVVMPGIVAVDSDLSGAQDDAYTVTPDVLAVDAFDFSELQRDALQGGVTTVYLSPGRQRLISGQGAVVKTAGVDIVQRVLDEHAFLRVNFADSALRSPRVFEPGVHPTDEDPLEPSRIQTPTARIGLLPELRATLREAASAQGMVGEGSAENRYDPTPLREAVAGTLRVRAAAHQAKELRSALALQQELGLRMVLEDPFEIGRFAQRAQQQGLAATFRMPVRPGQPTAGGEDRLQAENDPPPPLDAPAAAAAAGLEIGIAPAPGAPLRDYLLAVGLAVRHGLPQRAALRSVGAGAAKILGVDARVGTLQAGKDADFVVLSGDPFAIGTMVESTWVDGERVFERRSEETMLAIRCGKILDGEGRVYRGGTLLVQGSRIKALGEDLPVPYGARRIDLPTAVMTPGFLDAMSHLGLGGDGTGVPAGQPNQRLDEAIAHDDPMFGPALAAGITTVLTSGKDGGLLSGRVAAVKTGAASKDAMTVAAIAGQRAVFDAIGPDAQKPLRDQIDRAKKYSEQWSAYEKALAEWKSGKQPQKAAEPAPATPAPAAPAADPISGTWEATLDIQGRFQLRVLLDLKLEGTNVTGKVRLSFGNRDLPEQEIASGSWNAPTLKLTFRGMGGEASLEARVQGETCTGTIALGPMGDQPFEGKRIAKEAGAAGSRPAASRAGGEKSETGEPKKPNVDESLEPLRAVVEQRATLVVKTQRSRAIEGLVAMLEEAKVPYVLQEPEGAIDDDAALGGKKPFVLLGPEMVQEDGLDIVNAAAVFADRDHPVLLGSGECAGARFLPLHAAYAVRYGLSPDEALAALTSNVAKAFKLDARVGSLQKGKDADFVVFSGDPFEPTSRVLLVGCNGELVVDNRKDNP